MVISEEQRKILAEFYPKRFSRSKIWEAIRRKERERIQKEQAIQVIQFWLALIALN